MAVISFVTQRGGCAKTTSAVNVSYLLAKRGYRVLAIDLDPQGHLSKGFGLLLKEDAPNLFYVFRGEMSPEQITVNAYGVDIWPSTKQMFNFEKDYVARFDREFLLAKLLDGYRDKYDYIIIDNQPALSLLVVNALVASDWYMVPVFPETWSIDGLKEIQTTVHTLCSLLDGVSLRLLGLFLANVDPRTNVGQFVQSALKEVYVNGELFETYIPRSIVVAEAIITAIPLCEYSPESKPAVAYASLVDEMLKRVKGV